MSKFIKLERKSVRGNRVFKLLSLEGLQLKAASKKLGTLEYKKGGEKQLFLNVNQFSYDFLKGSAISKRLLSAVKHSGLIKSPWIK